MAESLRVRCPFCGMHPRPDQLAKMAEEEPDPVVRLFLVKFGGKKPAEDNPDEVPVKKGRGKAPGAVEWNEVTGEVPEQLVPFVGYFRDRAKKFLESEEAEGGDAK